MLLDWNTDAAEQEKDAFGQGTKDAAEQKNVRKRKKRLESRLLRTLSGVRTLDPLIKSQLLYQLS